MERQVYLILMRLNGYTNKMQFCQGNNICAYFENTESQQWIAKKSWGVVITLNKLALFSCFWTMAWQSSSNKHVIDQFLAILSRESFYFHMSNERASLGRRNFSQAESMVISSSSLAVGHMHLDKDAKTSGCNTLEENATKVLKEC